MTDNSQAAHEAAMAAALAELNASPKHGLHDFARAYIAHLRPQIEAQSREAALREARQKIYLMTLANAEGASTDWIDGMEDACRVICDLIKKEPTNAG